MLFTKNTKDLVFHFDFKTPVTIEELMKLDIVPDVGKVPPSENFINAVEFTALTLPNSGRAVMPKYRIAITRRSKDLYKIFVIDMDSNEVVQYLYENINDVYGIVICLFYKYSHIGENVFILVDDDVNSNPILLTEYISDYNKDEDVLYRTVMEYGNMLIYNDIVVYDDMSESAVDTIGDISELKNGLYLARFKPLEYVHGAYTVSPEAYLGSFMTDNGEAFLTYKYISEFIKRYIKVTDNGNRKFLYNAIL